MTKEEHDFFKVSFFLKLCLNLPFNTYFICRSVAQLHPTLCDPHGLQVSFPSLSPRVYSNSRPLNWWYHPTISSSVVPFSSCLESFPESGSFPISQFFTSGGQSIGASPSVLQMNIQGWFPLGLTGLISLVSKGYSRVFSNTTVRKHQFFSSQSSLWSNSHIHTWLLENPQMWLHRTLSAKWCLCFLMCCLGLSWLFFQGTSVF